MNGIENRIKKLEQRSEPDKPGVTIVYVYDGRDEAEAEAAKQKAIDEYKVKHHDWLPSPEDWFIQVIYEDTRDLIAQVKDRTGKLIGSKPQ